MLANCNAKPELHAGSVSPCRQLTVATALAEQAISRAPAANAHGRTDHGITSKLEHITPFACNDFHHLREVGVQLRPQVCQHCLLHR